MNIYVPPNNSLASKGYTMFILRLVMCFDSVNQYPRYYMIVVRFALISHAKNKNEGRIMPYLAGKLKILVVTGKYRRNGMVPAHTMGVYIPET